MVPLFRRRRNVNSSITKATQNVAFAPFSSLRSVRPFDPALTLGRRRVRPSFTFSSRSLRFHSLLCPTFSPRRLSSLRALEPLGSSRRPAESSRGPFALWYFVAGAAILRRLRRSVRGDFRCGVSRATPSPPSLSALRGFSVALRSRGEASSSARKRKKGGDATTRRAALRPCGKFASSFVGGPRASSRAIRHKGEPSGPLGLNDRKMCTELDRRITAFRVRHPAKGRTILYGLRRPLLAAKVPNATPPDGSIFHPLSYSSSLALFALPYFKISRI